MKTKILMAALILAAFTFSCKKSESQNETDTKTSAKQCFNVEFFVNATVTDDFTVYYTETGTNEFAGDKAAWKSVVGGNKDEIVVVDLPQTVVPTNIRVDFGIKADRKDVILQKLKFAFYERSFEVVGSDFFKYFVVRKDVKTEIDPVTKTIKFIKTPEQKDGSYFYPTQLLLDNIKSITVQ